ncbi:unnamed protein product [Eruca vesicaria subsp. sativa]|uniref:Pyridine nucleotide-disulphide oxidoreductase N-terminal domain-containing protein n=1 Tax=Eruca vesicaria subsp. sativa TaxID=29727 RepID=A0ABC8IZT3_ERUVS|nr:unnamed protein product [Eruca vesicaria subsp. sativa]
METHKTKICIIGIGSATHTAAIYASRTELKPLLFEGWMANAIAPGGQLTTVTNVENFPGFPEGYPRHRHRREFPEVVGAIRYQDLHGEGTNLWWNFLSKYGSKVYIIHMRDTFRVSKIMQQRAFLNPIVEMIWNSLVVEAYGDENVKCVLGAMKFLDGKLELDEDGYVVIKPGSIKTTVVGVFAAGDWRRRSIGRPTLQELVSRSMFIGCSGLSNKLPDRDVSKPLPIPIRDFVRSTSQDKVSASDKPETEAVLSGSNVQNLVRVYVIFGCYGTFLSSFWPLAVKKNFLIDLPLVCFLRK